MRRADEELVEIIFGLAVGEFEHLALVQGVAREEVESDGRASHRRRDLEDGCALRPRGGGGVVSTYV